MGIFLRFAIDFTRHMTSQTRLLLPIKFRHLYATTSRGRGRPRIITVKESGQYLRNISRKQLPHYTLVIFLDNQVDSHLLHSIIFILHRQSVALSNTYSVFQV